MNLIELSHLGFSISLILAILQCTPLFTQKLPAPRLLHRLTHAHTLFIFLSFCGLLYAFAISDFSLLSVRHHSHSQQTLIYKIAAAWSHHEGSLLFWIMLLSLTRSFFLVCHGKSPQAAPIIGGTITALAAILGIFSAYTLFEANPFLRSFPFPQEGIDINPLLHDSGLLYHPPTLYLGAIGYAVVFSIAIAALRFPVPFPHQLLQKWARLSWGITTLGIVAGSWWAYYVLGWGGWWFWDPVENVSLFTWVMGLILLHVAGHPLQKRRILSLALGTFSLFLFGFMLVRAGILLSVHNFAQDLWRGMGLSLLFVSIVLPATLLFMKKAPASPAQKLPLFITLQNGVLLSSLIILLIGTLSPLVLQLTQGQPLSIDERFFQQFFWPLTTLFLPLMALSLMQKKSRTAKGFLYLSGLSMLATYLLFHFLPPHIPFLSLSTKILLSLPFTSSFMLIFATLHTFLSKGVAKSPLAARFAHLWVGVFVLAITMDRGFTSETYFPIAPGQCKTIFTKKLCLNDLNIIPTETALAQVAPLSWDHLTQDPAHTLTPSRHFYYARDHIVSRPVIDSNLFMNRFLAIGSSPKEGEIRLRVHQNMGTPWIWISGILLALSSLGAALFQKRKKQ